MPIPRELVERFATGNGSIFVGAGLSMGAGLPSWSELVAPLRAEIPDCPAETTSAMVADYYESETSRLTLISRLKGSLLGTESPTRVHAALLALSPRRIFTTNFDRLIEQAAVARQLQYRLVRSDRDIGGMDESILQIVKIHGDLDTPETVIVTSADYDKFRATRPGLGDLLKVELAIRTALFLGYSHSDQDLNLILSQISTEGATLRGNLYSLQISPHRLSVARLRAAGVIVINLELEEGEDRNQGLERWLRDFWKEIEEARRLKLGSTARPKTNNLPARPEGFLGRYADMRRIFDGLRSAYPLITAEGFAGVGKTSLAVEVGNACIPDRKTPVANAPLFEFVVWISAKDKPEQRLWLLEVLDVIATTADSAAIAQLASTEVDRKRDEVGLLVARVPILLIIDNFETIDDPSLVQWLEDLPAPSKALVTTRNKQFHQKAWPVSIGGLNEDDAIAMLRSQSFVIGLSPELTRDQMSRLSTVSGGNPQILKLALGLVRAKTQLEEVVEMIHGASSNQDVLHLFDELFASSWNLLGSDARKILLTTPLFVGLSSIRRDALQAASGLIGSNYEFDTAISELERFGLLEPEAMIASSVEPDARFIVHSATRSFAAGKLSADESLASAHRLRIRDFFLALTRKYAERAHPGVPYWNALVSDDMRVIDPEWPSIHEVIRWAQAAADDETVLKFTLLLVHYLDSRFLNSERLACVRNSIRYLDHPDRRLEEALLRIDALGWTFVEENRLDEAYHEINRGFKLAAAETTAGGRDLMALGFAWRARVRLEQQEHPEAELLIGKARGIECSPWIKYRVHLADGDIALRIGDSGRALDAYLGAEAKADEYGGEGNGYQTSPRIGLAYLASRRFDEAEAKFRDLRRYEEISIGKLYADFGLAMVSLARGQRDSARILIEEVRERLARRTSTNLLMKMIERFYSELETGA